MALLLITAASASAQYVPADTLDRVEISWKWAAEKWYSPGSDRVMVLRIANRNETAVEYSFQLDISRDGVMLESSGSGVYCIAPRRVARGRLNGIVIRPSALTREDILKGDFELELELESVRPVDRCEGNR